MGTETIFNDKSEGKTVSNKQHHQTGAKGAFAGDAANEMPNIEFTVESNDSSAI
jgi:hypothetical protein